MEFGEGINKWTLKPGDTLFFAFSDSCNKAGEVIEVRRNKVIVEVKSNYDRYYKATIRRGSILGAWQTDKNKIPVEEPTL